MIRFETNKQRKIIELEHSDMRAYNILCPKCFAEWKYNRGTSPIYVWFYNHICGKYVDDTVKAPCGCFMSAKDVLETCILVDEFISRPVSRINRAGYITKFSCSGHMQSSHAYLAFANNHDELVHYITNDPYLSNVISVEVEIKSNKKKMMDTYVWDTDKKGFVNTFSTEYEGKAPPDNMTIRLNKPEHVCNLSAILLFRRCLTKIAKWCETTNAWKESISKMG